MSRDAGDKMSEKDRMLAGRYYYAVRDPQLLKERKACQALCAQYNATEGVVAPSAYTQISIVSCNQIGVPG
jgi:hypothetical protein